MAPLDLELAFSGKIFGFARLDSALKMIDAAGELMAWAPPSGAPISESPVFFAMEAEFARLRDGRLARIDLPGLRLAPLEDTPFSVSVLHDPEADQFFIFASADRGAHDIEKQLARERRETRLLADQAASAGRMIREQAALYRDIVETASDLVFRLGADLRVTFVNAHACRLLAQEEAQIVGRAMDDALGLEGAGESWRILLAAKGDSSFEQALAPPGGEKIWMWWSVHWVGDPKGAGEYQALGRDISDLRRLRVEAALGAEEARRNAVMRERLRIAHDLHDTLVHSLVALAPQLRLIRKVAGAGAGEKLLEELGHADAAVRDGLARARAALSDLRAQNVEPQGLSAALETLGRRFSERTGVPVLVEIEQRAHGAGGEMAEAFYRITEEALRNAELHASADEVRVSLSADDSGTFTLIIADDGRGFDPSQEPIGHFGLVGMREQAEMVGGRFAVFARPDAGVRIEVVASAS
jgi:PAS domain S-box-containing protein